MSISIINYEDFLLDYRLDSEHYSKELMDNLNKINEINLEKAKLKELTFFIKKGIFYILKEEYVKEGIPFIRVSNTNDIFIDKKDLTFITEQKHNVEKKTKLVHGDLVVSKSGTLGNVSIVPSEFDECNISQDIIGISVDKNKINPFYLLAYLKSSFGQLQLERGKSQAVQAHLNLDALRNLIVIKLGKEIQEKTEKLLDEAYTSKIESEKYYLDAQELILNELSYDKLEEEKEIVSITNYDDLTSKYLFNAEYYSSKYIKLNKKIKSIKHNAIKNIVKLSTKKIKPEDTPSKKYNYVAIADIDSASGIIKSYTNYRGFELPSRARLVAKKGDVLVPYLGGSSDNTSLVYSEIEDLVVTTGFYVVSSDKINPETLFLLFRTPIIKNQIERLTTGAIMSSISKSDFQEILIPDIPQPIQKKISEMINSYFKKIREKDTKILEAIKTIQDKITE